MSKGKIEQIGRVNSKGKIKECSGGFYNTVINRKEEEKGWLPIYKIESQLKSGNGVSTISFENCKIHNIKEVLLWIMEGKMKIENGSITALCFPSHGGARLSMYTTMDHFIEEMERRGFEPEFFKASTMIKYQSKKTKEGSEKKNE